MAIIRSGGPISFRLADFLQSLAICRRTVPSFPRPKEKGHKHLYPFKFLLFEFACRLMLGLMR